MSSPRSVNPSSAFWLARRAVLSPDREALVYWRGDGVAERWTYRRLDAAARALAAWMRRRGIRPGDRVAFLDLNDVRFAVTMFAAARLGAIFVPLNFRLSEAEIVDTLRDCDARLLVYGAAYGAARQAAERGCGCANYLLSSRDAGDEFAAAAAEPADVPLHDAGWDEPAWLLYTSGSTGRPKGVMLSHGNIFWNTINIVLIQGGFADDRVLISAPLFHAAPIATFMESFLRGALIHLEQSFDAERLLGRIAGEGIRVIAGVPAMYRLMAAHPAFDAADLSTLRAVIVGGAPVPEALIAQYRRRGVAVIQRYGLTEAAPLVTALPPGSPPDKQTTAGLPALFGDLRLRGAGGGIAAPGEIGEIEACGPNIMQGYWNREAETREVLVDGWLRTGDLGRLDADGYLTVVGRSKDMIISGGENVYAAEVEARLAENPVVLESAVIGVPDEKWGEAVCAIVSLQPGRQATAEDVLAHLQGRLARYKQPKRVVFVPALPKNGSGKIDKLQLRRTYGGGQADGRPGAAALSEPADRA